MSLHVAFAVPHLSKNRIDKGVDKVLCNFTKVYAIYKGDDRKFESFINLSYIPNILS